MSLWLNEMASEKQRWKNSLHRNRNREPVAHEKARHIEEHVTA